MIFELNEPSFWRINFWNRINRAKLREKNLLHFSSGLNQEGFWTVKRPDLNFINSIRKGLNIQKKSNFCWKRAKFGCHIDNSFVNKNLNEKGYWDLELALFNEGC